MFLFHLMVVMTNVYLVLYLIQFHPGLRCSLEHLRVHSLELCLFLIDCATRSCRYREGEGGGSCSAGGVGGALAGFPLQGSRGPNWTPGIPAGPLICSVGVQYNHHQISDTDLVFFAAVDVHANKLTV